MISTLAPSGVPYRMSVATASARLRVRLIKTISRALPRIVAAIAHAQPTLPAPTIPIFMDVSIFGYQLVRCWHRSQKLALHLQRIDSCPARAPRVARSREASRGVAVSSAASKSSHSDRPEGNPALFPKLVCGCSSLLFGAYQGTIWEASKCACGTNKRRVRKGSMKRKRGAGGDLTCGCSYKRTHKPDLAQ